MAGPKPTRVELTTEEWDALERLVRAHTTAQQVAVRAQIILAAAEGLSNVQVGQQVGLSREAVRLWRDRWVSLQGVPLKDLSIADRLADAPRPGAPVRIGAEQVCAIIALACEAPTQFCRPITQWTAREIADEITGRGIVETISPRHAARLLKRGICNPIWSAIG
jgi:putative transposase